MSSLKNFLSTTENIKNKDTKEKAKPYKYVKPKKTLENTDIIKNNYFSNNEKKYNNFIKIIKKLDNIFLKLNKKEQNKKFKEITQNLNLNLTDKQINNLRESSLNIIETNNLEKALDKKFSELSKNKEIQTKITNFSQNNLPTKFKTNDLNWFYETPFEKQKYAWKYILDSIANKLNLDENGYIYSFINKILTSIDLNKKNTAEIATSVINSLEWHKNDWFIWKYINKIIDKLKHISNNSRETEYFFKNWTLTNTETIWLYNNNPNWLGKYNWEKAPDTVWHNQITTRIKFVEQLKSEDIKSINSNWLIDYFYKTKIKYWDWSNAIWVIYAELWPKKFNELKEYINSNNTDKKLKWNFSSFVNDPNNKQIIWIMSNFHWFQKTENTKKDMQLAKIAIEQKWDDPIFTIVSKQYNKIKKWKIPNTTAIANLTWEIAKNPKKTNFLKEMASKAIVNWFKNKENLKKTNEIIKKLWNNTLSSTLWNLTKAFTDFNIDLNSLNIPPEKLKEFEEKIITHPDEVSTELAVIMIKNGNLPPDKIVKFENEILTLLWEKYKNLSKFITVDLKILLKNPNKEKIKYFFNKLPKDKVWKDIFKRYLNVLKKSNKNNKNVLKLCDELINKTALTGNQETDQKTLNLFKNRIEKIWKWVWAWNFNVIGIEQASEKIEQIINNDKNINKKTEKVQVKKASKNNQPTDEATKILERTKKEELNKTKEWNELLKQEAEAKTELAETGFYNEDEKKEIYQEIYYATYLDNNFKNKIKQQAEKEWIKLDLKDTKQNSKSIFIEQTNWKDITETIFKNNTSNISFDYKKEDWLIKIKNPFWNKDLWNEFIKWKDTKEVNQNLLLDYFQNIWFYQADELLFSKDTEKIYEQFNIDISKPLTLEDIKNFTKILAWWIIYKLKEVQWISSISKKYIKHFEQQIISNPNNPKTYKDLFIFLNDNIETFIKTWFYDFTEKKINLENFINKYKNENFKIYLRKNKLDI